ncbi:MAG: hypothetical protein LC796_02245 [Acidobacteria bacterium]|nr:hypothetical protein [Acidobacteriota bacterium]MCA1610694.1 hypothetical protein [Acidobacteriota bacterium]
MEGFVKWLCPECGVQRTPVPEDFVLRCPTCDFSIELAPDVDPNLEATSGRSQISTLQ